MKFAVIVFPGSNCDRDMYMAVAEGLNEPVDYVWYTNTDLAEYDGILLPGGFSYGDYLRTGAIARFAPVMKEVELAAHAGKLVLGVCNGFQILLEAGLLPGGMLRNRSLKFRCSHTILEVSNSNTAFTRDYQRGEAVNIPIAHGEGNYFCDQATLASLEANDQIVFRYLNNPNGSVADIAGIINKKGNVLGMMPHPERAMEQLLGSADGKRLFTSMVRSWREQYVTA